MLFLRISSAYLLQSNGRTDTICATAGRGRRRRRGERRRRRRKRHTLERVVSFMLRYIVSVCNYMHEAVATVHDMCLRMEDLLEAHLGSLTSTSGLGREGEMRTECVRSS